MKNVPKMILCEQVKKWFESTVHTVHKKKKTSSSENPHGIDPGTFRTVRSVL